MIWQGFIVALSFFTRIPLPQSWLNKAYEGDLSLSPLFYPAVGIVIGLVLCSFQFFIGDSLPNFLSASLLLCCWIGITGALHLDGFADCIDAYYASHKSPERVLEVMAEPQIGSMAVVYTCLLLIVKCAAISALLMQSEVFYWALLFVPVVARFMVLPYMLSTNYVREQGMASTLDIQPYIAFIWGIGGAIFLAFYLLLSIKWALVITLVLFLLLICWRHLWIKKIGGYTGDCAGGLIEITELVMLLSFFFI